MRLVIIALLCAACSDSLCSSEVDCRDPWMTGATCCAGSQVGMCVLGECSPQSDRSDEGEE